MYENAALTKDPSTDIQNEIFTNTLVILIDDEKLVRLNWSMYCKKHNLPLRDYSSIDLFLNDSGHIPKNARIFIDSHLGQGIKGEIESEKIFKLGFKNLYLATGYEKESINRPSWILGVHSKSPEVVG